MNSIEQMTKEESVIAVRMLINLAREGYVVVVSAGTNTFCVALTEDGIEVAISEDHKLSVALANAYEMTPEKDDACKHPGGVIRGMEGWQKK